jgi:hypothetical protein
MKNKKASMNLLKQINDNTIQYNTSRATKSINQSINARAGVAAAIASPGWCNGQAQLLPPEGGSFRSSSIEGEGDWSISLWVRI